jgi:hypothetical protein
VDGRGHVEALAKRFLEKRNVCFCLAGLTLTVSFLVSWGACNSYNTNKQCFITLTNLVHSKMCANTQQMQQFQTRAFHSVFSIQINDARKIVPLRFYTFSGIMFKNLGCTEKMSMSKECQFQK